jgi:hypothetical protein
MSLSLAPQATGTQQPQRLNPSTPKGPADGCVVQQALFDAGGVRTGGYPKCSPLPGPLGFQRPADWDVLWSPARTALKALPAVKPGQLVSALPGMMSITKKVRFGRLVGLFRGWGSWGLKLWVRGEK